MKRSRMITGLDIGSSKISAVAAEIDKTGAFTILAQITHSAKGVSRGAIVGLNDVTSSVSAVLTKLRGKTGESPGDIYVNISGETVKGAKSTGMVPLSLRGREITKTDMDRCADVAGTIHLPFDREIVHKIVQRYSIDDRPWINNPLGLYGSRLACETYVITADVNHIQNVYKCVNNAGHDVRELVFTGIADSAALLDREHKESNVLLLDMGASLTEICAFAKGILNDLEIIQVGADDIKTNFKDNERFNSFLSKVGSKYESFLKSSGRIDSILLTGGTAFVDDLIEFMEEKLGHPMKIGVAKEIKGDISSIDSARLTTAIGLARYANQKLEEKKRGERNIARRVSDAVVDIFNNYF